ncbi:MAG: PDR/VanB family oxidoreductase [Demequina sp.]|uniref:PDR/VanB family oxidoreductase n=1 Tax=Demequina sp. TaxID=2050685 RepID=UPI003A87612D
MSAEAPALSVVVASVERLGDVVTLVLESADGTPLPSWEPGAHIDVAVDGGAVRQYSLCGAPGDPTWRVSILREQDGRGGSRWLAEQATPGVTLAASVPRNHFAYQAHQGPVLFLAAGIGITPILAMAHAAASAGADYSLAYSGAHRDTMVHLGELAEVHGPRLAVHAGNEGARLDIDATLGAIAPDTTVYACGPARYLDAVQEAAERHGVDLRVEHFTPIEAGEPIRDEPFEVELAITGVTVTVEPGTSVLSAVEEAGALVLSSCTEGTCGTCETPVLEGVVDHRDSILTPAERERHDVMYVCVSRAACPRLVLDL